MKYNAFCVISDGVNNKMGSLFSPYEFFYAWRKVNNSDEPKDGIDSLFTMVRGLFDKTRLVDVISNFIFFPYTAKVMKNSSADTRSTMPQKNYSKILQKI